MSRIHPRYRRKPSCNYFGFPYGITREKFLAELARRLGCDAEAVPLFLTDRDVARATGTSVSVVRDGIEAGVIVADKVNGRWLVCRDAMFPAGREPGRDGGGGA